MADIRHIVVLMLENRSFDSLLGGLSSMPPAFNGLTGREYNLYKGQAYPAGSDMSCMDPNTIPDPDPGESYVDITQQVFGSTDLSKPGKPAMSGFAANYAGQAAGSQPHDPQAVMHHYTDAEVPVLHQLAKQFGVSDQWFASAPCQTWPNRFFAHTGTCYGIVNNCDFIHRGQEPFHRPSIFRVLEDAGESWRVYFHDFPQSLLLEDVWHVAANRYRVFAQFLADAHAGALPLYSFIEPNYFADVFTGSMPNDQHPPHDVRYGDQLVATVYNALRASKTWEHMLFVITYDEHGGCYDHEPPPPAVAPGDGQEAPGGFKFDAYGVRVPAVIVSPWIPKGSLLQPQTDGKQPFEGVAYPFDHTSIIKTVRTAAGIGQPLTDRDEAAPGLQHYLTLPVPGNMGPLAVKPNSVSSRRDELFKAGSALPNDLHAALGRAAERLAPVGAGMRTIERPVSSVAENVAQVGARAVAQARAFLGFL